MTLGYCFSHPSGKLAYLCDTVGLPAETISYLKEWQADHIVLDCTYPPQENTPRNHNDFTLAMDLVTLFKAAEFWLTHINHSFDHWLQSNRGLLPGNVHIARDKMEVICAK